jgi:ADP-ribosylglycohydrolase
MNLDLLKITLLYASFFDTLGFNNIKWETNYNIMYVNLNTAIELNYRYVTEFFRLGGLAIDLSGWNASDDTILQLYSAQSFLKKENFMSKILNNHEIIFNKKRYSGNATIEAFNFFKQNKNKNKIIPYHENMGGNGPATRTPPLGILLDDEEKIIKEAFINSLYTHNYTLGFLGGIGSALITFFAKKKIHPKLWLEELLKQEKKIDQIILNNYPLKEEYLKDRNQFWNKIKDYHDYRTEYILTLKHPNPKTELEKFTQLISRKIYNQGNYGLIGSNGVDSILFAYEAVLKSLINNKIDLTNLIIYSTLHSGDNDSTGAIAGSWYGAYHQKLENLNFKSLEFYHEINNLK